MQLQQRYVKCWRPYVIAESTRPLPNLAQALLDLLRSGEPSFHKDSSEYQFRRVLFETLNRLPLNDALRSKIPAIWAGMLHVLLHENDENGITASKMLMDIVRGHRSSNRRKSGRICGHISKGIRGYARPRRSIPF
jgi:transformation/transcription domain-associated protein